MEQLTGVAGEGHEQIRLAELPHNCHGILILLLHVPGPSNKTGTQYHRPPNSANIVASPDGIGEAGVKSGTEFPLVMAVITEPGVLQLRGAIHNILLAQPAPSM